MKKNSLLRKIISNNIMLMLITALIIGLFLYFDNKRIKLSNVLNVEIPKQYIVIEKGYTLALLLVGLAIFFIIVLSIFTNKYFSMLKPLNQIVHLAKKIEAGEEYEIKSEYTPVREFRKLLGILEAISKKINYIEYKAKKNEKNHIEHLNKVYTLSKILMRINMDFDMEDAMPILLKALTSEAGLGYSRGIYFRYSRETNMLYGEESAVNFSVSSGNEYLEKGFNFQMKDFDNLIKSIRIPYKSDNLMSLALKERHVIYQNQKGYKVNLGNDLFKSLGINNFMIIPIYSDDRNYGCILLDYFGVSKAITDTEFRLMSFMAVNISIRIKSKIDEERAIAEERTYTVRKIAERFINSPATFKEDTDMILKKYDDVFSLIDLEELFTEILQEKKYKTEDTEVEISMFANYSGKVYGKRVTLKKIFLEILKNSYKALILSEKKEKKINIHIINDTKIDKIKINILDNGIGMKPEFFKNIYTPFINEYGNIPGLGLPFVYKKMREHNAVIKIYSTYNEGTEVRLTFNENREELQNDNR